MKESTIYNGFSELNQKVNQIVQFIQNFTQSVRLDSTGKEIRLLGLQKLLIEKGLITEAEMTAKTGEVIQEMQKQAEEEAKKATIVTPTTEQVAQVNNTAIAQETPVVPPQA